MISRVLSPCVHGAQLTTNWTVTQESQLPAKEEMKIGQVLPHASKVMKHENMPTALEISRKSDCGLRRQEFKMHLCFSCYFK